MGPEVPLDRTRGVLRPDELPRFTRAEPVGAASELVEWYWVPEWDLPPGVPSCQSVLSYPAANLVIDVEEVTLHGATTRLSHRTLIDSGWAVGALLRPAGFAGLAADTAELVDSERRIGAIDLRTRVARAMRGGLIAEATGIVGHWLVDRIGAPTPEMRLANEMARLLMTDATVLRVEDAAARLNVSVRTLQRLAHRTVGLPPAAMIRRRRLQEAAQRVREHPDEPLSAIAAQLGYTDQAHLANDFRNVLGFTASSYRG